MLKLFDHREKVCVLGNCYKLKGNSVSVSEDFSAATRELRICVLHSTIDIKRDGTKVKFIYDKLKIGSELNGWDRTKKIQYRATSAAETSTRWTVSFSPAREPRNETKAAKVLCRCLNLSTPSIIKKTADLEGMVIAHSANAIVITETWLHGHIGDREIMPYGYRIYRKNRDSSGGCGAILYMDSLRVTILPYIASAECYW